MNRLLASLVAATLGCASATAFARNDDASIAWQTLASTVNGSFNQIAVSGSTVSYGPTLAMGVRLFDDKGKPADDQSADSIERLIADQFPVARGTLQWSSQVDSGSGNGFSLPNAPGFNYMAVHFGNNELLFQFAQPQTSFRISGLPHGFSNYRAYLGNTGSGPVAPVPEPAEWAMMLGGMGVVGAIARRRKAKRAA